MTYGDFKDLSKRTVSGKVLHDKALNVAKSDDGYERSCFDGLCYYYKMSDAGLKGRVINSNLDCQSKQWPEELHKSIIIKFKRHKI